MTLSPMARRAGGEGEALVRPLLEGARRRGAAARGSRRAASRRRAFGAGWPRGFCICACGRAHVGARRGAATERARPHSAAPRRR